MLPDDDDDDAEDGAVPVFGGAPAAARGAGAGGGDDGGSHHCAVALYASSSSIGFAWIHPSRHIVECGEVLCRLSSLADALPPDAAGGIPGTALPAAVVEAHFRWLQLTLGTLQPRVIIAPNKGSPWLTAVLGSLGAAPTLQPPAEFSAGKCREQLKFLWPDVSALSWASRLNLANTSMLMALSALLSHIIRAGLLVADIQEVAAQQVMQVDPSVLKALHVFREERHPAAAHGVGAAKEALSLFAVLSRVQSAAGRLTLRQWCSVPSCDVHVTQQRHDAVEFFAANADLAAQILACLRMCRHPGRLVRKMQTLRHGVREYKLLEQTCSAMLELLEVVQAAPQRLDLLRLPAASRLLAKVSPDPLKLIVQAIRRTVDFSVLEGGGGGGRAVAGRDGPVVILSGVDTQLDELRLYLGSMDGFLTAAAQRVVNVLPPFYRAIPMSVTFFPSLGYLVAIDTRSGGAAASLRSGEGLPTGWDMAFATEEGLYCKTDAMRELDLSIGDVHATVVERMAEVQRVLDVQLLSLAPHLLPLQDCGEVECLVAFAVVAREERWVRPAMCDAPVLALTNAFHPLLSRASTANHVVPFVFSVGRDRRVCVVTGANGSGKSVFVHTIPLIVFMAHIGCFVPCSAATIGMFDQLLLDTGGYGRPESGGGGSGPSLAPELSSSFGTELCLVSRFVEQASPRGIVMLDEFGKGTLANDGIALLASIIEHFVSLGDQGPLVLLTTHYTEIFASRLVDIALIQRLHMKIVAKAHRPAAPSALSEGGTALATDDDTQLCYLYQPEQCSTVSVLSSHAFHCAIAASVPPAVAKRALHISRRLTLGAAAGSDGHGGDLLAFGGQQNQRSVDAHNGDGLSAAGTIVSLFLNLPLDFGDLEGDDGAFATLLRATAGAFPDQQQQQQQQDMLLSNHVAG